ncbi:MAG TPA: chemotaxis protein CheW [Chthoniobacterales bacterium]|jgi:chemotaxis-related protein WspB|nr:chemotaxis protein CheW [Chthoniobacterales bacterium]
MLFILFQIGRDRYALPASDIIEILPLINLKEVPGAPTGVAGVLNYRGTPVPVIDLNEISRGAPAAKRLSTRIILVKYPLEAQHPHALGLIAEHATNMIRRSSQDFIAAGVESENAPYLGRVANDGGGLIQWIEVEQLLTLEVRDALFREPVCP